MAGESTLVLITGGSSGIGAATAIVLREAGYRALVTDIAPRPEDTAGSLVWPDPFDISDEESVQRGVAGIEHEHGPIGGLVNAAGVLGRMHPPERIRMENWDREMNIDLRGAFLVCRAVGIRMTQRGRGSIVNVASIAGMTTAPAHAYAVAKAGVIHLTATLAAEWGRRNVRVNAVSPGFTRTPALNAGLEAGVMEEERLARGSALGRIVEPREIAEAIAWLISPASSAVTGINLPVDAGFLAGVTWDAYGGFR